MVTSANWLIALTGQVDVEVAWRVMEWPRLKGSVFDCRKCMVTAVGERWMSDHCRFDDVNSLALRKP